MQKRRKTLFSDPRLALTLCAFLTASLGACGEDQPYGYQGPFPTVATPDPVAVRLADAADKAATALQSLSAVEQTRTPSPLPPVTPADPGDELEKTMSVEWNGPVSPLLLRLATRIGYHYSQIGTIPTVPVTVNIDVSDQPILEILRDSGMQMGARANLVIDANRHVIELQYAPDAP